MGNILPVYQLLAHRYEGAFKSRGEDRSVRSIETWTAGSTRGSDRRAGAAYRRLPISERIVRCKLST